MNKHWWWLALSTIALVACGKKNEAPVASAPAGSAVSATEEKLLNIYNWPDYIAKDMVANFEKESGIKVNYQTFENNEALQAKLVAGNTGYDISSPPSICGLANTAPGTTMS